MSDIAIFSDRDVFLIALVLIAAVVWPVLVAVFFRRRFGRPPVWLGLIGSAAGLALLAHFLLDPARIGFPSFAALWLATPVALCWALGRVTSPGAPQ